MKAYYYTARIDPPSQRDETFEYFKAYSKKQIKKHIENNGWKVLDIYDPIAKPVHGIYYQDVTEVQYDREILK